MTERDQQLAGVRVLVVDDQEHVRHLARRVLNMMGVKDVTEASDGAEAISLVTRPGGWFDLVLCDLRMPERDGIETLRAFASFGVKSGVAIMSGEDERIIETVGLLAEAHGLRLLGTIQKPVTAAALEELFKKLRDPATGDGTGMVVAPAQDIENAFKRGELLLQYQPKVWLSSGELAGAEALIRWNHPEYGMFQPGAFVPLIEESAEHTRSLAEYTLREAIAAAGRSARRGVELRLALNLSRRAFNRLDLPEWAESLCIEHGVPPSHVTLEVTETAVKHDWIHLLDVASRLRLKGFALSVDDFGTGESGLSQLKRLPFSELKIDREFVDGCSRSATQRSVVEASLALARSLGMTSVAEGVQYKADWDVLIDLGCDMVQGYYVSPPLSEDTLAVWRERETPIRH